MAKKSSCLVERLKADNYVTRRCPGWFEKLPEGAPLDDLRELHAAKKNGDIPHSIAALCEVIGKELNITVTRAQLENWLKRATPDG